MDWKDCADKLVEAFASTEPTPGGGAAAGTVGALGCALGQMAAGISLRSKKADEDRRRALREADGELGRLRSELQGLTSEDAEAFGAVMAAYKLPKGPDRPAKIQEGLQRAADVPLRTARASLAGLRLIRRSKEKTLGTVSSDMDCAAHLLRAAVLCALENVSINISLMKDENEAGRLRGDVDEVRGGLDA